MSSTRGQHRKPNRRWRWLALPALAVLPWGIAIANSDDPTPPVPLAPVQLALTPATPAPTGLTVSRVVDGDTVDLSDGRKVRLLGIDTPETVKPQTPVQCYGPEATQFAKDTLLNKQVIATADPTQAAVDQYGRPLVYLVLFDGRDYSVAAAEAGVARSYVFKGKPVQKQAEIKAAEQRAQQASRGLWGICEHLTSRPTPTTTRPAPAPVPDPDTPNFGPFSSCAAARAAGAAPVRRGSPGYSSRLDRDGDGVGCE